MKFLIQAKRYGSNILPMFDFGLSVIQAIDFHKWYYDINIHDFVLIENLSDLNNYDLKNHIPIGSVEFALYFYNKHSVYPRPINIPEELFPFLEREILITDDLNSLNGTYMIKDIYHIKNKINGVYSFPRPESMKIDGKFLVSEYIHNIESEWRIFVLKNSVVGVRNYLGKYHFVPNHEELMKIIGSSGYRNNPSFTIDVAVDYENKMHIIELHDFFSCGLYGFEKYSELLQMHIEGHKYLAEKYLCQLCY